ncbi:MAG: ribosome biogenesis GTPase Der [candidate division NC10 bacterium]|nr:ribosome biogenesis GTPase Der [candidate division NC10 bacterium]
MSKPIIAIVGRPNVGKSTLFNRLVGGRRAIVDDLPGVTRDRNYATFIWLGREYILIDTGGFEPAAKEGLLAQVKEQAQVAVEEADLVLFMVDAKEGWTPSDAEIAQILRREACKPVLLVVNKVEGAQDELQAMDFYSLGFGKTVSISAEHGLGIGELLDEVATCLPERGPEVRPDEEVTVAVIGRPNVGKSSLINRILGERRVIVDAAPGTTRDAVDTPFVLKGKRYVLVDTAGIRAKGKLAFAVEKYSVIRALKSIERSAVAVLLLDATEGVTEQDARIASFAEEAGAGIVLAVNKWDLVERDKAVDAQFVLAIRAKLKYLDYAPILLISALTGRGVLNIFDYVDHIARERRKRIKTAEFNQMLERALAKNPPPAYKGRPVKIFYATQPEVDPPTFVFFTSDPDGVPFTYRRYLANQIREAFDFFGCPLRLYFRQRKG